MKKNFPNRNSSGLDCIIVEESTIFFDILLRQVGMKSRGIPSGIALVVDDEGRMVGTITSGDIRRGILKKASLEGKASDVMNTEPIVFNQRLSYQDILKALPTELSRSGRSSARFLEKIVLVDDQLRPTRVLDYHHLWEQRVATHRHVCVIGLGYVGLTLSLTLAEKGYYVTGVDVDKAKIDMLSRGELYVHEIGLLALLKEHLGRNFFAATGMPEDGDVFIVSVGTPVTFLDGGYVPDLEFLRSACEMVGRRIGMGALVILRSTVPIGTTQGFVKPLLESISGLNSGTDFHLAFAPERTVEGDALRELVELPQVIGGVNTDSVEAAAALFREFNSFIVRVDSCEAAEMIKLINNCFRDLVFSFSNEMAMLASKFNIDIVKVIRASNSGYPRDPVPLPSPGVGGPCLTKDPYILASVAHQVGISRTLGEHGREINEKMIGFISDRIVRQLEAVGKTPSKSKVLICGLSFKGKPETGDLRNSPALDLSHTLSGRVGFLYGHDPVADYAAVREQGLVPVSLPDGFRGMDVVAFMNNHDSLRIVDVFQMVKSMAEPAIVFDGWSLFLGKEVVQSAPCVYLSLGHICSSVPKES